MKTFRRRIFGSGPGAVPNPAATPFPIVRDVAEAARGDRDDDDAMSESRLRPISMLMRGLPGRSGSFGSADKQFIDDGVPTVSVSISMRDLQGAVDNGLQKRTSSLAFKFRRKRIRVEASEDGVKDFVFFAPEGDPMNRRATPTEFVKLKATPDDASIVRRDDDFEISFIGMSVTPQDTIFGDKNELLLYSLKTNPAALLDPGEPIRKPAAIKGKDKDAKDKVPKPRSKAAIPVNAHPLGAGHLENFQQLAITKAPPGPLQNDMTGTGLSAGAGSGAGPSAGSGTGPSAGSGTGPSAGSGTAPGEDSGRQSENGRVVTAPNGTTVHIESSVSTEKTDKTSDTGSEPSDADEASAPPLVAPPPPPPPTTGFALGPDEVPFIHYDPVVDGHDVGTSPNSFVPVPASKALYLQHHGQASRKVRSGLSTVSVRFNVLEIDRVSDAQARAVGGVGDLGDMVKSTGVPYLQPLSMALNAASTIGKEALKNYSKPDHVLSKDLLFLLAEPEETAPAEGALHPRRPRVETYGNFLRYGYYFFLGKKVDAKLYAQTGSSSQVVPLLLRRHPFTDEMKLRDDKEYFPLTGVSYVVIKVSPGCSRRRTRNLKRMYREHKQRLDNMLQMSDAVQMLANSQK